ncbi:MAG: peptidylprolyl isomerase SurA [Arsenophonus sp. ET-KM2-MAG3]
MNYYKKIIISFFFIVNSTTVLPVPQELDKITAIVNNGIILQSNVDNMLNIEKINARNKKQKIPNENTLRYQILESLIIEKIILQIAEKMHVEISDKEVDYFIINTAAKNKLTLIQLYQRLSNNNINLQNYRSDIRKKILISEILNNEIRRRIIILPQEVDLLAAQLNFKFNQDTNINLSYILIPMLKNSTNKQTQLAINIVNEILIKLKQGADFNKISITYSTNHNVLKSKQIGWSKIKELPIFFVQRIQHAKKGDIIGPIFSNIGFYILRLNDIQNKNIPIFVTEVKARHIFIKTSSIMNNKQAYKKIQQVAKQIQTGQITFIKAAKKYSQDVNSALHGGQLGWNMLHVYDMEFRDILMHLSKGEISQPINSSFGWHLIQLEDIRQVDKTNAVHKEQAYRLLFNRKFNEEIQNWTQELRASAYIKIFNNNLE